MGAYMENKKIKNINRLTRKQAIKKYCLECCLDSKDEVRKCISYDCSLWKFRRGVEEG